MEKLGVLTFKVCSMFLKYINGTKVISYIFKTYISAFTELFSAFTIMVIQTSWYKFDFS